MRKVFVMSLVIVFAILNVGIAGEKTSFDASTCAVDNIINYYASMAKLKNLNSSEKMDYKNRLAFFKKNRTGMITKVAQIDGSSHLGRAHQICENMYKNTTRPLGYTKAAKKRVNGPAYFDAQTGHRYIKQNGISYAEFTKRGVFIKMVPSSFSLLNKSRNVYPITNASYILYEKYSNGQLEYQSLPGNAPHPKGWKAKNIMISLK